MGHATEYSLSSVIGGTGLSHPEWSWDDYCDQFQHQCAFPGSPCKGPRLRPSELCPGKADGDGLEYLSDDELDPATFAARHPDNDLDGLQAAEAGAVAESDGG